MKIGNYPSPEVKAFGERVNAAMYDASIRHTLGGLGGCKEYNLDDFDPDVRPYIQAYLEGDLDSVAITYAAMRAKELEAVTPTLVVECEPDYWSGGHFHPGTKSWVDPVKVWGLPIGTKLYVPAP